MCPEDMKYEPKFPCPNCPEDLECIRVLDASTCLYRCPRSSYVYHIRFDDQRATIYTYARGSVLSTFVLLNGVYVKEERT